MAAADDAFMGALEAAERELKATGGGAASSSSAQTPATDAADEAGVSNSPAGGPSPTAPYAASDDEPDVLSPTAAAASSAGGEVEHSPKERSGRGSDERRSSGGSGRHRGSTEGESRSTFKARVIKEVKTALHGFFSAGRITSKEDFKELARELAHKILSKDPKKTTWDEKMPARVQKYVDQLFARDFVYDPSRNKTRKESKDAKDAKVAKGM